MNIKKSIKKVDIEISRLLKIRDSFLKNFRQGAWRVQYKEEREGVSQALSRKSFIDSISHIRRINVPCDKNTVNTEIRRIHPTQYGFICPCETPEGRDIGLTKYLASLCIISNDMKEDIVKDIIRKNGNNTDNHKTSYFVFLNGVYRTTTNSTKILDDILYLRRYDKEQIGQ